MSEHEQCTERTPFGASITTVCSHMLLRTGSGMTLQHCDAMPTSFLASERMHSSHTNLPHHNTSVPTELTI
jgi:hypothetical protein